MKTTKSERFHVDVDKVLAGAKDAALVSVALIGIDGEGELYVAASDGTGQAINLFKQAEPEIERLSQSAG